MKSVMIVSVGVFIGAMIVFVSLNGAEKVDRYHHLRHHDYESKDVNQLGLVSRSSDVVFDSKTGRIYERSRSIARSADGSLYTINFFDMMDPVGLSTNSEQQTFCTKLPYNYQTSKVEKPQRLDYNPFASAKQSNGITYLDDMK